MPLIKPFFPASSYLDPASEAEFRHHLVQKTRASTKRLALICIGLMLIFCATDILLGDSWHSLNNLARYAAVAIIWLYLMYSVRLNANNWLQGWLAVSAAVIVLLAVTFYASGQYFDKLGEGGPMLVAFAIAAMPIFHLQQKLLLWLLLLSNLLFIKYCSSTDTGWGIFYLLISITLCLSWQRQFDKLLRNQFKAVRLEQQKAETDQLTGLLNRRSFEQRLMQKLTELSSGQQLSLGLLDIDYFKRYNDHYGHLDGDLVLVQIARLLSANPALTVVRFGGEEFILIEQHAATEAAALLQLPAQLASLAIPHAASPFGVVTASIGVVTLTDPTCVSGSGELMQQADVLLYQAKQQGRNQAQQRLLA
ncbi:MAG: GGDEF domain-containing protein [Gammaproteobacteria bacterium]|nr:GGDEF domain-containing protein [Gammaproteobacteria bacterium]MBU1555488.1 GGDEF domain-containing protein [Gammaproteobacteria bacterium]MBU2070355.1 GGDEF domain-containing protein [Gammaproteobacteria bacterium]MBU2184783.1 GGDEF domain-containing protein [Gammaproteobacteria bacterium]MBU2203698.1 GGDEF domain-containing protein [Gammaproteobacteria bacterium]